MARGRKKMVIGGHMSAWNGSTLSIGEIHNRGTKPVEQLPKLSKTPVLITSPKSKTRLEERGTHGEWEPTPQIESTQSTSKVLVELILRKEGQEGKKEEPELKKWSNLFQRNHMAAQGMKLNYIAPTVDAETLRWKHVLILYVVGVEPTITAIECYIAAQWNYLAKPKAFYHNDSYFLVRFGSFEDRDKVLNLGPHILRNKPIIVKTWVSEFDLGKEIMQTFPVWVKFPNLPLNCWDIQSLSRISSGLGIPLFADKCITQIERVSYGRVLIEMDIIQKLPVDIKVEDPNGREFTQNMVYEWVPVFYPKCLIIGHKFHEKGEEHKQKDKAVKRTTEWQLKRSELQAESSNTLENSGLVEVISSSKLVGEHRATNTGHWRKMGGSKREINNKRAKTKHRKVIIPIENKFNPLHDHDTRPTANKDKGLGGAGKELGK
ncbi:hypothetical protein H5410_046149, partial [Solanum commersonii]